MKFLKILNKPQSNHIVHVPLSTKDTKPRRFNTMILSTKGTKTRRFNTMFLSTKDTKIHKKLYYSVHEVHEISQKCTSCWRCVESCG